MKVLPTLACVAVLAATAHGQFFVRSVKAPAGTEISNTFQAATLLASEPTVGSGFFDVINFVGAGSDADFAQGVSFPGLSGDTDDFAIEARGYLSFNRPGTYVFQINSDAGFRFSVDNEPMSTGVVLAEFTGPRSTPADTNSVALTAPPVTGPLDFILSYFERTGGEEIEFSYSLDGGPQQLVGSTSDITISQIPEPGALALLGMGLASFAVRRRGIFRGAYASRVLVSASRRNGLS